MITPIRHLAAAAAFIACTSAVTLPVQAADLETYVAGATTLTLLHEAGHMLIAELNLPNLAREEDAADTIGTLVMLNQDEEETADAIAYLKASIVEAQHYGARELSYLDRLMWDEHSMGLQRAYAMICLMYGADPALVADIPAAQDMNERRRELCTLEYEQALASFVTLMAPHALNEGEVATPLTVKYEETTEFTAARALIADKRILEEFAEAINEAIRLPREITVLAGECGEANAFFYPGEDEAAIVLCYEYVAGLMEYHASQHAETSVAAPAESSPGSARFFIRFAPPPRFPYRPI